MTRLYTALADYADNQVAFRTSMQIKLDDATAERILAEQPGCIRIADDGDSARSGAVGSPRPGAPYQPHAALGDDSAMHSGNMPLAKGWNNR